MFQIKYFAQDTPHGTGRIYIQKSVTLTNVTRKFLDAVSCWHGPDYKDEKSIGWEIPNSIYEEVLTILEKNFDFHRIEDHTQFFI